MSEQALAAEYVVMPTTANGIIVMRAATQSFAKKETALYGERLLKNTWPLYPSLLRLLRLTLLQKFLVQTPRTASSWIDLNILKVVKIAIHLGTIQQRSGVLVEWDPGNKKVTGKEEAVREVKEIGKEKAKRAKERAKVAKEVERKARKGRPILRIGTTVSVIPIILGTILMDCPPAVNAT